jgi:hypothetical protein
MNEMKPIKTLEQKNAAFNKMPKWRRRVAIARDVIAQINIGKLNPMNGTYFDSADLCYLDMGDEDVQLQGVLQKSNVSCNVCAIGALFTSGVLLANKCTVGQVNVADGTGRITSFRLNVYLRRFFSQEQLTLIEGAFEGWNAAPHTRDFFSASPANSAIRLRLIMENIIANKGTFKPSVLPVHVNTYITPGFKG